MVADGVGADGGWPDGVADKQCGLTGGAPQPGCSGASENVARNADDRVDVVSPLGVCQAVARREDLDQTGLVTGMALLVGRERAIERCGGFAQRRDGVMQDGLVCLDLGDQMNAACAACSNAFFDNA